MKKRGRGQLKSIIRERVGLREDGENEQTKRKRLLQKVKRVGARWSIEYKKKKRKIIQKMAKIERKKEEQNERGEKEDEEGVEEEEEEKEGGG